MMKRRSNTSGRLFGLLLLSLSVKEREVNPPPLHSYAAKPLSATQDFSELRRYSGGSPDQLFRLEAVFQRFLTGMLNY